MIDLLPSSAVVTLVAALPAGHALYVYAANVTQTDILGIFYSPTVPKPGEPRPLICPTHGAQRFDWNGRAYVCQKCRTGGMK